MTEKTKLLIVGEDEKMLVSLRSQLGGSGFKASTHSKVLGISYIIKREQVKVVLIDLDMPGIDGDGLVGLIRGNPDISDTSIILLSSRPLTELEKITRDCNADACIEKSMIASTSDLVSMVRDMTMSTGSVLGEIGGKRVVGLNDPVSVDASSIDMGVKSFHDTILVVDGKEFVEKRLTTILASLGFRSDIVRSGEDGINMATEREYGLIIMDVIMPEKYGVALHGKLIEQSSKFKGKILFITETVTPELKKSLSAIGCSYLTKPFSTQELKAMIDRLKDSGGFIERRKEERFVVVKDCELDDGNIFKGSTQDISSMGARISYCGYPIGIKKGVSLTIKDNGGTKREALVVWSNGIGKDSSIGIRMKEALPPKLMQGQPLLPHYT
ncbi:MAG: response regulator [Deltaproteobacteria bacterium]|nr:response regulator [Deltaproteobacteria bacterium]